MAEVPEHLLRRSQERRKALGLPVPGEEGAGGEGEEGATAPEVGAPAEGVEVAAASTPEGGAPAAGGPPAEDVTTESGAKIPAHLLERAARRRAATAGGEAGVAAAAGAGAATATIAPPAPTSTGPGGHTQRLLTVVKSGSIQQTKAEAQDKVHVWPHLLVIEFASILILLAAVTIFSALVRAPLLSLADVNKTPNPSKAPWYFLGLQELLTMFHPMVAGVTIPGVGLGLLAFAPYIDKNPSQKPNDRKFAIAIFTMFIMLWAVLVIIGSFFRGPGFNFIFPWKDGIFFEL
jgi:menaquinol-cytochrome c reductase cytochrome b/c subunit